MTTRIATALSTATIVALGLVAGPAQAAEPVPPEPRSAPLIDLSNLITLPDIVILSPSQQQACAGSQQQFVIAQQQTCDADPAS